MSGSDDTDDVARAAAAVDAGDLVVYPTETVYGLGADALDPDAVGRVFDAKRRDRGKPLSAAAPDVETALGFTAPTERERAFMDRFLPGPVTVVTARTAAVPDVLTAGGDRVGVRVPDHPLALRFLRACAPTPVTATSANVSGRPSVTRPADLDPAIRSAAAVVVDGGETPGGVGSTVVDVARGEIHRRGAIGDAVEAWLADH